MLRSYRSALAGFLGVMAVASWPLDGYCAELVIPWPAGGETDKYVRPIAPFLAKHLGRPVSVVNSPGNFGATGLEAVAKGVADGSVFVTYHDYIFSVKADGKVAEDPSRELAPVCGIVGVPSILATHRKLLAGRAPADFLKSRRSFTASWTVGPTSTNFMMLALFEKASGAKVEYKPHRSKEAAVSALNDGEVDLAEIGPADIQTSGQDNLVMLGIASPTRDRQLPQVPTLKELGLDVDYHVIRGLGVPKSTPVAARAELERACKAAAAEASLDAELQKLGARAQFVSSQDLSRLFDARRKLYESGVGPRR